MKAIRIGNDIRIEWPMVLSGDVSKLADLNLSVEVRPSRRIVDYHNYVDDATWTECPGKKEDESKQVTVIMNGGIYCRPDIGDGKEHACPPPKPPRPPRPPHGGPFSPVQLPYHIEDNKIIAIWTASEQFATGEYDIVLYAKKAEGGQAVVDQCRFVRLVAHTAQADDPGDGSAEAVIQMQPVTLELSGLSAYEVAVVNGFSGTEAEWLESLKQPAKDAAEEVKTEVSEFLEDAKSLIAGRVKVSELDTMVSSGNLTDFLQGNVPTRYIVTDDKEQYVEGMLTMFADSMGHNITQVFITHDILTDGELGSSHSDDAIHTYYRSYHVFGGTSTTPVNTWSAWQPVLPDMEGSTFYGFAKPADTPKTSKEKAYYIATEAGAYLKFLDLSNNPITLSDGEVAVLSNTWNGDTQIWSKNVIDVAHKDVLQKVVTGVRLSDSSDDENVKIDVYNTFKDSESPINTVTIKPATAEKAGAMSASDKAQLDDLKKDVWPLNVTFTASPTLMEYTGAVQNVTLGWAIKRRGNNVTATSIVVKAGESQVYSGTTNPGSAAGTVNAKGTTKCILAATAEGMTATAEVNVQQVLPMYFGFNSAESADGLTLTDLTKQTIKTSPNGTYTLTNHSDGNYLWLCVPDTMTISKVTLNGFDVPMEAQQGKTSSLGNYKCYRNSNALVAGTYTFVIS